MPRLCRGSAIGASETGGKPKDSRKEGPAGPPKIERPSEWNTVEWQTGLTSGEIVVEFYRDLANGKRKINSVGGEGWTARLFPLGNRLRCALRQRNPHP